MTRKFGEAASGSYETASGDAGTAHEPGPTVGSHGRSAPCAASRRSEGGRPARPLLAPARGAEDVSVLRKQIVQRLPKVGGLRNPRQIRQFSQFGDRVRRVIAGQLCLVAFRF